MSKYVTMEELRDVAQLGDLAIDPWGQMAIDSAEEAVEDYCGRRFWADASATIVRYYSADASGYILVDDLVTLTTLKTDDDGDGTFETTWAAADSLLYPFNAAADSEPYTEISVSPGGSHTFPAVARGVEVSAKWGWPAIPDRVKQAVILQANRWVKRAREAPFGIETVSLDGQPVRIRAKLDPDVEVLLGPLRRFV